MEIKVLATGSSGNCYWISDGETELLIECGIKFYDIVKKLDYDVSRLQTVLVSHAHKDHSESAIKMVECGYDLIMPFETAVALGIESESNVFTPQPNTKIIVGTMVVIPFNLVHYNSDGSECPCYGYLIASVLTKEKLLFATDTAYIRNTFKTVDYMLIETNYIASMVGSGETEDYVSEVEKRRLKSHMSLETAIDFLERTDRSRLKEIYAIHKSASRFDSDKAYEALKGYAERVIIA